MVFLAALGLALLASLVLARRMVSPIRKLQSGAQQIGAGDLTHRIHVDSGDELQELAEQFNHMGAQLQDSYADLERRIAERTRDLEAANQAKSRFLAAASHDLRQPIHALTCSPRQLDLPARSVDRKRRVAQIKAVHLSTRAICSTIAGYLEAGGGLRVAQLEDFAISAVLGAIMPVRARGAPERISKLKGAAERRVSCIATRGSAAAYSGELRVDAVSLHRAWGVLVAAACGAESADRGLGNRVWYPRKAGSYLRSSCNSTSPDRIAAGEWAWTRHRARLSPRCRQRVEL